MNIICVIFIGKGYRKVKTKGSYKSGIVCKARIVARFYKTGELHIHS